MRTPAVPHTPLAPDTDQQQKQQQQQQQQQKEEELGLPRLEALSRLLVGWRVSPARSLGRPAAQHTAH